MFFRIFCVIGGILLMLSCDNTVNRFLADHDSVEVRDREPADESVPVFDHEDLASDHLGNDLTTGEELAADPDDFWDDETTLDEEEEGEEITDTGEEETEEPTGPDSISDEEEGDEAVEPDLDEASDETMEEIPDPDTTELETDDAEDSEEALPDEDSGDLDATENDTQDLDNGESDLLPDPDITDDSPAPDGADFDIPDEDSSDDGAPDVDFLDETISLIDKQNMTNIVYYLASPECAGRNNNTAGSTNARNRIIAELTAAGIEPGGAGGSWTQSFAYWCPWYSYNRGNNIIGFIEGNDPSLKNEFVVLGAHYDHLGTTGSTYYPGADDNASGSAMLIEIAAALKRIEHYLDRSVVFIWFDSEEDGLCGSEYYVDHPIFSLSTTVYMIDLDMVGYLRNNAIELTDVRGSNWAKTMLSALADKYGLTETFTECGYDCSDHAPFYNAGIPSLMITTGLEDVYHKTTDTADKINYDGMVTVAAYTTDFAYQVNTHIAPFFAPFEFPTIPTKREFRDHGVLPPNTPRD